MTITPTLIVDDSLMITKIIKKALLSNTVDHYYFEEENIFTASDGMEAFAIMGKNKSIKLIISDINMPNLNGDEFVEILQDTDRLNNLDVVFITSSSSKLFLSDSIKEHILGVIYKPFKFDCFNERLNELQLKKIQIDNELKVIKKLQITQKKHIKKNCIKYLSEFEIKIKEDLLKGLIAENFSNESVSKDEFAQIIYSILSSYLFELDNSHKISTKRISCILKSFDKKVLIQKNRFGLIDNFKNQIVYVNSNEISLKEVLKELTMPLWDKLSIAFVKVRDFPKLKPILFSSYFEYITEELMTIDCDFMDDELQILLTELKELTLFNKWMYNFLEKEELYTSVDIIKKSTVLKSEVTKRLRRAYQRSLLLSQHYCGQIEYYIWSKAKRSLEITQYFKENMPKTIPSTLSFLLHKEKVLTQEQSTYLINEQQKIMVMSNELQILQFFKEIVDAPFNKWDFFCYSKTSLLDAWIHSNIPDKIIIDYDFNNSIFDNGIQLLKYLITKYPALKNLVTQDKIYMIANNNQLLELNKYKNNYNFTVIQEPLNLKDTYENLLYQ